MERDQASEFINNLLKLMLSRNGSDLFITAEFPPAMKVDGKITKVSQQPLNGRQTLALARAYRQLEDRGATGESVAVRLGSSSVANWTSTRSGRIS